MKINFIDGSSLSTAVLFSDQGLGMGTSGSEASTLFFEQTAEKRRTRADLGANTWLWFSIFKVAWAFLFCLVGSSPMCMFYQD